MDGQIVLERRFACGKAGMQGELLREFNNWRAKNVHKKRPPEGGLSPVGGLADDEILVRYLQILTEQIENGFALDHLVSFVHGFIVCSHQDLLEKDMRDCVFRGCESFSAVNADSSHGSISFLPIHRLSYLGTL